MACAEWLVDWTSNISDLQVNCLPTQSPTNSPSLSPSISPTRNPSTSPSLSPTRFPSQSPVTPGPTLSPTPPTFSPTPKPFDDPNDDLVFQTTLIAAGVSVGLIGAAGIIFYFCTRQRSSDNGGDEGYWIKSGVPRTLPPGLEQQKNTTNSTRSIPPGLNVGSGARSLPPGLNVNL